MIVLHVLRPIVGKGHGWQALTLSRGVHLALQTCIGQVTNEDAVRAALGQRTEMLLQIRRHALQNRGKTARTGGKRRLEGCHKAPEEGGVLLGESPVPDRR